MGPPPAAPDDAGEAAAPAVEAVHEAVIEATDAVIGSEREGPDEPVRNQLAPAKQDVDAIDVIDAMGLNETIVTDPVRDTGTGVELERPDKVEPIEKQEQPPSTDITN